MGWAGNEGGAKGGVRCGKASWGGAGGEGEAEGGSSVVGRGAVRRVEAIRRWDGTGSISHHWLKVYHLHLSRVFRQLICNKKNSECARHNNSNPNLALIGDRSTEIPSIPS